MQSAIASPVPAVPARYAAPPTPTAPARFVSIPEFVKRSSLSRATIYALIERGEIDKPVRLTRNRVAFPSDVVDAWFAAKMQGAV